jgi:hypothetical protein
LPALPVGAFSYWKFHGGSWVQLGAGKVSLSSDRKTITLTLTDGASPDDDDGVANGVIVDAGGPAIIPHAGGVMGYVFPGAGSAAWDGTPKGAFGAILTSIADHANKGDLIFAMSFTPPTGFTGDVRFRGWDIYIPPEFGTIDPGQVTSTITNDYAFIRVGKASWNDPFGPGWTVVQIRGEDDWGATYDTTSFSNTNSPAGTTTDRGVGRGPGQGYIAFTAARSYSERYYVRINGVSAPTIAGRYFFKYIMRPGGYNVGAQGGNEYIGSGSSAGYLTFPADFNSCSAPAGFTPTSLNLACVPVQNWPVLLVKGEIDPAIIDGIVRYAGTNTTLYGKPLNVAGRVRAVGTAIDPYTGQSTGRAVEARGYFNATARGHYEIEGVAPGVYTIYAEAAGFPEQVIASNVKILAGQSLHFDGLLNPGVVIHGQVFSKHNFGEETWTRTAPVRVEIWNSNDYSDASHMVAQSPWDRLESGVAPSPFVNNGVGPYGNGRYDYAGASNGARMAYSYVESFGPVPTRVAFDWEFGTSYYTNTANGVTCGTTQTNTGQQSGTFSDVCRRHDGVGPAQYWWVDPNGLFTNGGGSGSFIYQFGYKIGGAAIYGAPKDLDGHVPQALITYINGMTPGRYYVRAYVNGYVQTALDGRTFQDYFFDVAKDAWSGDVTVPLDLLKSSYITKTVHFHDIPGSLIENPVKTTRTVMVEVWDVSSDLSKPVLRGWNITEVVAGTSSVSFNITGFGLAGFTTPSTNTAAPPGLKPIVGPHRVSTFGWQGVPYEDYGLPAGTYEIRTYVQGYVQQTHERVTIALSNSPASVSDHMWKGAHFNVTVFSTDWEQPRVERPWNFPGEKIYVYFTNSKGNFIDYDAAASQTLGSTTAVGSLPYFEGNDIYAEPILNTGVWGDGGFCNVCHETVITDAIANGAGGAPALPTAFDTDTHTVTAYTYGYVQKKPFSLFAQKGNSTSDIKVNLVQGANITLNLKFKLQNIFEQTPWNMSMRVRVFNEKGQLAAAWLTSPQDYVGAGVRAVGANFNSASPASCPGGILNCYASAYARQSGASAPVIPFDTRGFVLDYVPAGTTDLQVNLAGIEDGYYDPARSTLTSAYNAPDGTPAPQTGGDYPYGIDGYPNYQGTWTIEVDTMNWYNPTSFYPPVAGLLQGESFHTIPGHPNGLYGYVGDALSANHLGPFAQKMVWTVPNAHLGGESSVTFELDQRAYIAGRIDAFTWSDELRPVSFATITMAGANGFSQHEYTWDGVYQAFLNPGDYNFTVTAWSPAGPGFKTLKAPVHLSDGQSAVGQNFGPLERSNMPIPEFSGLAVVAFSALAASLYLLRRRR